MNKDKIVWFCESCESANNFDDLKCSQCGDSLTTNSLIFNVDEGRAVDITDVAPSSPYFISGGVSVRDIRTFSAVWAD